MKEQNRGFFSTLLGALGASLLGNPLTGKGIHRAGKGKGKGIELVMEIKWIFNTASSFN